MQFGPEHPCCPGNLPWNHCWRCDLRSNPGVSRGFPGRPSNDPSTGSVRFSCRSGIINTNCLSAIITAADLLINVLLDCGRGRGSPNQLQQPTGFRSDKQSFTQWAHFQVPRRIRRQISGPNQVTIKVHPVDPGFECQNGHAALICRG